MRKENFHVPAYCKGQGSETLYLNFFLMTSLYDSHLINMKGFRILRIPRDMYSSSKTRKSISPDHQTMTQNNDIGSNNIESVDYNTARGATKNSR
jgi:hypothetical protein